MTADRESIEPDDQPLEAEPTEVDRGLACPDCGCRHFEVLYTRARSQKRIVRRRQCRHCGRRITTVERSLHAPRPE